MTPRPLESYRFFEVTGIELEYSIVDAELRAQPLVEDLFRAVAGRPVSQIEHHETVCSNELASHVFEIKTRVPERSLVEAEAHLVDGLQFVLAVLRDRFGARLLPTGMHPFLDPAEGKTWRRAGRPIYETYARVFAVKTHGWMNLQSCHINLPFGAEQQTVSLHNAICCLLPYLPALSASSPVYEGSLGDYVDNRLAFYRTNQEKIPRITGRVIPEFMQSYSQYRREILREIYRQLDKVPGAARLKHEWVNSRGAIVRFSRGSIEIRTLDTQECAKMDVAVVAFVRGLLKRMVAWLGEGSLQLPAHRVLVEDFDRVVKSGLAARVQAPHLRPWLRKSGALLTARAVLQRLLELAEPDVPSRERPYLTMLQTRLRQGNLSERIRDEIIKKVAEPGAGVAT